MAFGGFNDNRPNAPMAEINMVPLIDVMLVLLIVFMITAPLLTHSIQVDLPVAQGESSTQTPETVTIAIDGTGVLYWNDQVIDQNMLAIRLAQAAVQSPQPELQLRADRDTRYQVLASIMAQARAAGMTKLGFVMQPD